MGNMRDKQGFTLVELLVALMVTSIVLAAVATLTFAIGSANDATNDTSQKQARVRYTTLRISELIRGCKLICGTPSDDMAIWRADDNDDGQINVDELVYIERGTGRDFVRLKEFSVPAGWPNFVLLISDIQDVSTKPWLIANCDTTDTGLIPQSSNVEFRLDSAAPQSRFVSIIFDVVENKVVRQYQINAALRSWAGYLLDDGGEIVSSDDD
ncbi:MAG: PilW family protein [Planctomycetota bacterium]|jgi:prepilin-type N-terminal cleavage/methylation domain-containing protein